MRYLTLFVFCLSIVAKAQFDPAGGELGSKSIHKDHSSITAWASAAQISRGYQQIDDTALGKTTVGEEADAIGPANGTVISLGDRGQIILTFENPILNTVGYDFAVFENGFKVGLSYYLELAHVEVSSNGIDYIRFPSEAAMDTSYQINNFSYLNPEEIYNLAGKHQAPYGTLFDLEEVGLDQITHIRLIDVVGSIEDTLGSRDSKGRIINDPWPSPFESSGFDLDAVAVVDGSTLGTDKIGKDRFTLYPTVARPFQQIKTSFPSHSKLEVFDVSGKLVLTNMDSKFHLEQSGIYFLRALVHGEVINKRIIIQ